jgi:hypothetical protein
MRQRKKLTGIRMQLLEGQVNTCLISGVPVTKTTHLTMPFGTQDGITFVGEVVLTPSENGNVHFCE